MRQSLHGRPGLGLSCSLVYRNHLTYLNFWNLRSFRLSRLRISALRNREHSRNESKRVTGQDEFLEWLGCTLRPNLCHTREVLSADFQETLGGQVGFRKGLPGKGRTTCQPVVTTEQLVMEASTALLGSKAHSIQLYRESQDAGMFPTRLERNLHRRDWRVGDRCGTQKPRHPFISLRDQLFLSESPRSSFSTTDQVSFPRMLDRKI